MRFASHRVSRKPTGSGWDGLGDSARFQGFPLEPRVKDLLALFFRLCLIPELCSFSVFVKFYLLFKPCTLTDEHIVDTLTDSLSLLDKQVMQCLQTGGLCTRCVTRRLWLLQLTQRQNKLHNVSTCFHVTWTTSRWSRNAFCGAAVGVFLQEKQRKLCFHKS